MRVCVLFCRSPVRRPSCMAYSICPGERPQADGFFKVPQLAFGTTDRQSAVVVHYGDTGRIIATVFELLEPVENHSDDLLVTDVSDYSAHLLFPSLSLYSRRETFWKITSTFF